MDFSRLRCVAPKSLVSFGVGFCLTSLAACADEAIERWLKPQAWQGDNGDLKALASSLTGEMQKMVEEDLKSKTTDEATVRVMDEVVGIKSVRIVKREARGDDTMVLTTEMEGRNETKTEQLVMKKEGNDWKIAGPLESP